MNAKKRSRGEVRNRKLQKVAADLFLKRGYEGVTLDRIVELAGGSKSTVYSEFGGKCGLFIRSIENLCREANKPLAEIDYAGLNLEASLKKLSFQILKLITAKRSVELHRLAIGEALNCPEMGQVCYTHGPAKTASFIRSLLEEHRDEVRRSPSQSSDRCDSSQLVGRRCPLLPKSVNMKATPSCREYFRPRSISFFGTVYSHGAMAPQPRFGAR